MTDTKRVTFTTTTLMAPGSSVGLRFGADFLSQAEKSTTLSTSTSSGTKSSARTIRLNVELFQTDSNQYPEFNYAKLLHLEKKKIKKLKQKTNGFSDPFDDNDDDVARIAKELEKKYGNAYSTGRSKNKRDDVDIGMGYDESDSFIDNTEAYDELIPDEVETIEGGFYINCGALEFKKLRTQSYTTKTDELIKMPDRPRKRVISSSSEESSSSGDDDDDDDSEDDESGEGSVETSKSKSSASTNDKKPKQLATATFNRPKRKVTAVENGVGSKKVKEKTTSCSASSSPKTIAEDRVSDIERNSKKVEKTTTVKDMLKARRDNFLKSQTTSSNGESKSKSSAEDEDDDDDDDDDSSSEDSDDDDEDEDDSDDSEDNSDSTESTAQPAKGKKQTSGTEEQGNEKLRTSDTILPELDLDVLASIIEFRDSVKTQNLIGKKFQFDDKLSENFLKIDDSLLCLDKTQRSMVFAHLEFQLALPKYYFLRKAKQLRIKEEKLKSNRSFNKLLKAVTETMPAVTATYEAELRKYSELQANSNTDQPPKMPKKKFPWNTNLRNLLYDVYQVRWTSYPVLGTRKETLEGFITSYMREKVVDIWPKGWMRYDELQREIEKRKTAAKKAKEKKKAASAATSGQSSPNPNIVINPLESIQVSTVSSLGGATASVILPNVAGTTTTQPVTFIKQFEEFNSRSNANSDTDSVASSSNSSGLKRRNKDATGSKPAKAKMTKLNGDQTKLVNNKSRNTRNTQSAISIDLSSPSKRTDHSINHIMLPTEANVGNLVPSMASSIFSATTAAVSQPSKHSGNTHVIDLDNYKSVGDILQTSKDIQAAAKAAAASLATTMKSISRQESSGDSEIEIVGVFPAKQQNKKLKSNNRSVTPNFSPPNNEKTLPSASHLQPHHNSNNNNNRKKGANAGTTSLPGMDVNKMVNALMKLGDELQIKPILTSTAQQQTKTSTAQVSQASRAHQ